MPQSPTTASPLLDNLPASPDANIPQQQAAVPEHDIWVAASAGSGKTKVLTDRVLRLLLPDPEGRWKGSSPHRILCITFTKAAAALMALRVQNKLGEWAVMTEVELVKSLTNLLGCSPSENILSAARQLFSSVLDTTGGLSIMTIHAFCQSTLGRFAIEAGVTPGFSVLEEQRGHHILRQIINDLIEGVELEKYNNISESLARISIYMDLDKLCNTLLNMMSKSREINNFLTYCGDNKNIKPMLIQNLGQNPLLTRDMAFDDFLQSLSEEDLHHIAKTLGTGSPTYQENGKNLADWLVLDRKNRQHHIHMFSNALLSKKGEIRSIGKTLEKNHPDLIDKIKMALSHFDKLNDKLSILLQAEQTADLMAILEFCLAKYAARKKELNALDFNDLILKTRTLLESEHLDWVQYKLDEGIDHILVDEAQDTNIHQWEIIRHLSQEFLSGQGNENRMRSLFVVGDEKQSIFSFHGADPQAFQEMRDYFENRSITANRIFKKISLETSFRSTFPILQLADTVFNSQDLLKRLGMKDHTPLQHFAYRKQGAGLVELWDLSLIEKINSKKTEFKWKIPLPSTSDEETVKEPSISSPMASRIATQISNWIKNRDILESSGKPIEPRDILILVRTRTEFIPDLIRQLKLRGVPVSGIDRMKLADQIAIMDCIALAKFVRFPDDDLSLACVLRSPFIRLSEDQLMELALGRTSTLWAAVQNNCSPEIIEWLKTAIQQSHTEKPFDFFDDILNRLCPFETDKSGWYSFVTCLGQDCIDPLDEFLSYCLSKEEDGVFSLEELITLIEKSDIEIKRDTEDGDKDGTNQVRIMTVHASKGLEAPIVFLPDTMAVPNKSKVETLQWIKSVGQTPEIPLWASRTADGCKFYQSLKNDDYDRMISEYLRLLYVALTRPKDRLYIMGEATAFNLNPYCWYNLIYDAFQKLPHQRDGDVLRLQNNNMAGVPDTATVKHSQNPVINQLPDWISKTIVDDTPRQRIMIQPSKLEESYDRAKSPLDGDETYRFKRGILTHKLFQILPELPVHSREAAAIAFLSRMAHGIPRDIQTSIISETLKILNDAVFADVFGENSMAEVPVSGDLGDGRMISGQIDRLVIGHNKILIVDFKTNRPSPRYPDDIPTSYKNQLKAYKTALSKIFPDRDIACALLWTDQPLLMPISV